MAPLATANGALQGADGQPLFYPTSIFVRNTFIDCGEMRPASLDEFIQERRVVSCPTSRVEDPGEDDGVALPCLQPLLQRSKTTGAMPETRRPPAEAAQAAADDESSDCSTADTAEAGEASGARASSLNPDQAANGVRVLRLQDAIAEPPIPEPGAEFLPPAAQAMPMGSRTSGGAAAAHAARTVAFADPIEVVPPGSDGPNPTTDLPSMGSAGHHLGQCKPCAFFNSKGCSSGLDCRFCHICEPGEKKRRQKEKRAFFNTMRTIQKMATDNWPLGSSKKS